MGMRANDAGNGESHLAVGGGNDAHFAVTAGAFELDHIGGKGKDVYRADDARAAMRTAICHGGLFGIKYHCKEVPFLN